MEFKFSEKTYQRALSKVTVFAVVSFLMVSIFEYYYGFSVALMVCVLPAMVMIVISFGYHREEYPGVIRSKLTVLEGGIEYFKPKTGYRIIKSYEDVERSKISSFMGSPVLTVWFKGNQKLRFVGLENTKIAYDKIQARTEYRV